MNTSRRTCSDSAPGSGRPLALVILWFLIFDGLISGTIPTCAAGSKTNSSAEIKVSGFGLLGNLEMARLVRRSYGARELPPAVTGNFVEDSAIMLLAQAVEAGYLEARLGFSVRTKDDVELDMDWNPSSEQPLPSDLLARAVHFKMDRGVRYYFDLIGFSGLHAVSAEEGRRLFVGPATLLRTKGDRFFSTVRLENGVRALRDTLQRLGLAEARVTGEIVNKDGATGAVRIRVTVDEGLMVIARTVSTEVFLPGASIPLVHRLTEPNQPFSRIWEQKVAAPLRIEQQRLGYPDVRVTVSTLARQTNATNVFVDVQARVDTGQAVRLGTVRFEGGDAVRPDVLTSRIHMKSGGLLDRVEAEQGRERLSRIGAFGSVGLRYEPPAGDTRDVIYEMGKSETATIHLLAGYGSYEEVRVGLEFEERNMFRRAHDLRLLVAQSMKSTSADLSYTIPQVFAREMDVSAAGAFLRRQEIDFTRQEYGGLVGVSRYFQSIKTDASLSYGYQFLNAGGVEVNPSDLVGVTNAQAAGFTLNLSRDMRDHPLLPRNGLKLFANIEIGATALGGNVDFQRIILGGSWHTDLGGGRLLHLGLVQGLSFTLGGDRNDLPFNKRFFPGGENSIRGYKEGEASPLDPTGKQLGAEVYTQGNVELEQLLTTSWSLVVFCDAVGMAADRQNFPWDEVLVSVGGGIRWRTPFGPVRVEYGYNLNPRTFDPTGTLLVSVGFPF